MRHYDPWTAGAAAEQMVNVQHKLDVAQKNKLQVWLALAGVDNTLANKTLLTDIVNEVEGPCGTRRLEGSRRAGARAHRRQGTRRCA